MARKASRRSWRGATSSSTAARASPCCRPRRRSTSASRTRRERAHPHPRGNVPLAHGRRGRKSSRTTFRKSRRALRLERRDEETRPEFMRRSARTIERAEEGAKVPSRLGRRSGDSVVAMRGAHGAMGVSRSRPLALSRASLARGVVARLPRALRDADSADLCEGCTCPMCVCGCVQMHVRRSHF